MINPGEKLLNTIHRTRPLVFAVCCALAPAAMAQETSTSETTTTTTEAPAQEKRVSAGGLFIEPLVTFSREDSYIRTSQLPVISDDTSGEQEGVGAGLRLGVHASEVIFLGVDGRYVRNKISDSSYGNADANTYNVAPMIGVQTPFFGIRVYGGYVVLGETNPEAGNQGFDVKFTEPQGARVGVGFHIGPVALNVEYQDLTYNKTKIESYGLVNASGESDVDFDTRGYTASLSFPMEL